MEATLINGQVIVNGQPAVIPFKSKRFLERNKDEKAIVEKSKVLFGVPVANGTYNPKTNSGRICIVLDKEGNPTPVIGINQGKGTSYQLYNEKEGHFIIGCHWTSKSESDEDLTLRIYNENGVPSEPTNEQLNLLTDEMDDYLRPFYRKQNVYIDCCISNLTIIER